MTLYTINDNTGSSNQIFKQTYLDDGYFRLDPTHTSGMSLDLHGTTGVAQIYPTHNGSNQKFKTVSTGDSDGSVYIVSESGLYLTYNSSAEIYGASSPSKMSKWYIY